MENYGFIKVGCANFEVNVTNVKENTKEILKQIDDAKENDCSIVVFSQLCLTGYTCQDLFFKGYLQQQCLDELKRIIEFMPEDIIAVVGMPIRYCNNLYNCAVVVEKNNILSVVPKINLNRNELRWFTSGKDINNSYISICDQEVPFGYDVLINKNDMVLAVEIGEDIDGNASYIGKANVVVNIASDIALVYNNAYKKDLVKVASGKNHCAYIYNTNGFGESSSDFVFNQMCLAYQNGTLINESFNNIGLTYMVVDIDKANHDMLNSINSKNVIDHRYITCDSNVFIDGVLPEYVDAFPFVPKGINKLDTCLEILNIQARALASRFKKIYCNKVVIGISGGLDSTLALLVCIDAFKLLNLDSKNIIAITLPGLATTTRTKNNALELMELANTTIRTINISTSVIQHLNDIDHPLDLYDVAYENAQARERTQILMDVANSENAIVVGTGDLSELALGWCTYNGDHMSNYSVNGSISKTLVKELVKAYADVHTEYKEVLYDILDTPISPELIPSDTDSIAQKTEDTIGKYDLHDFFIYHYMRNGFSKEKIFALACVAFKGVSQEQIKDTLAIFYRRFYTQQFKRSCLPDGPKVGSVGVSPRGDWMMPSDISRQFEENN